MEFYSHAESGADKKRRGSKTMLEHTNGVRENALRHFIPELGFSLPQSIIEELLKDICQLHDLGKYSSFFQTYLLGGKVDTQLKSHARLGAYAIYKNWMAKNPDLAFWGYFLIKNHHSSLHWPKDENKESLICKSDYSDKEELFRKQKETMLNHWDKIEADLACPNLRETLEIPVFKDFRRHISKEIIQRSNIQDYFFLNYLFSLLIEADKLDASQTSPYKRQNLPPYAVDDLLNSRKKTDSEHNKIRSAVRRSVLQKLDQQGVENTFLFTLTAPTGIGKTLTALDFALRLRDKLSNRPQIITALPFINIIEQTIDEYKNVLANYDVEIMGHYQYADIFGDIDEENSDFGEYDIERLYSQKRMQLSTWQSDIVITSFVQMLQTLIGNRNKMLLKFHHFANAIVIMDEVQNISLEQAPFIGSMIYYCSRFLKTRFILMTATKPLIFELTQREIINKNEPQTNILEEIQELLPNPESIYRKFNRTKIIPLLQRPLKSEDEFCQLFSEHWKSNTSCLIVCNKVNRSLSVFRVIESYLKERNLKNQLYYLSTNVLPIDRMGLINRINQELRDSSSAKPILIATQVVEAGVDIDFDCGFRDLGPVDAIVQVAGRINRENSVDRSSSPLFVFDFGDCADVYSGLTAQQAKKALGVSPIEEPEYFDLVDKYFGNISDGQIIDFGEARARFEGVKTIYYTDGMNLKNTQRPERLPVSDFQIIKNAPYYITVFIEKTPQAKEAKNAFLNMLAAIDKEDKNRLKSVFDRKYRTIFQQHTLPVPKAYTNGLPLLIPGFDDLKILYVSMDDLDKWYQFPGTGFVRTQSQKEWAEHEKQVSL